MVVALPSAASRLLPLLLLLATAVAQEQGEGQPLGPGPSWRGPVRPTGHNEVFATGDGCSMCHLAAPQALAMRNALGDDVSPYSTWQGTLMANSFRDPYWRATVAKEVAAAPGHGDAIQALCQRCHAPMAQTTAILGGQPVPSVAAHAGSALAQDGVSCTVCHQIQAAGLGTEASWSGGFRIGRDRAIFGPFADVATGPMRMHSGYTPQAGAHVQTSALCATCHTLFTHHVPGAPEFPEQTPYLEWRNSEFSDEGGRTATSRTCQECHMAEQGDSKIARNPMGRDFVIPARPVRAHAFVGGNAFLLDLLDRNREALQVTAPAAALQRMALATRAQLSERTARLQLSAPARRDGRLCFDVRVENLTGHKFPTGYPSRRAWLHVQVRDGSQVVFESGAFDQQGRLYGIADELAVPHRDVVEQEGQVVVYELVAADADGRPTTHLVKMAGRKKDTRLLPRGHRTDGKDGARTAPVGTGDDHDFVGGGDTVHYRVPLPAGVGSNLRVLVWLHYQPIPPAWVEALRGVDADAARSFVPMYDAADNLPETVGLVQKTEG